MSSEKYQLLAKTFAGLENVLKTELEELGASDVAVVEKGVKFSGSKELMYRANFCCRTALCILRIIGEFKVNQPADLYDGISNINWQSFFSVEKTFSITSTVDSEAFNNSGFISLKTKDAILDQFRTNTGKRPFLNEENPDIRINVHASSDSLIVFLDSSGEPLNKRGYRLGQNDASMNEVLTAGLLKLAGWKGQCDLYDPMCGSGTVSVEAALIARNIPPGIFRKSFAFESWTDFDAELFEDVYNDDYEIPFSNTIYASDVSPMSVKVSEQNARNAGLKTGLDFKVADFSTLEPVNKNAIVILDPAAVDRNNDRLMEAQFGMIGTSLKKRFKGIKSWIFSNSDEVFRSVGLRPSETIVVYNGSKECSFRLFELYDGTQKEIKSSSFERTENSGYSDRTSTNSERRSAGFKPERRFDAPADRRSSDFNQDRKGTEPRREQRSNDFRPEKRGGFDTTERRSNSPFGERKSGNFKSDKRTESNTDFVPRRPLKETKTEILSSELKHSDKKGVFQPKDKSTENIPAKPKRKRI